jgi:hypothetical protein
MDNNPAVEVRLGDWISEGWTMFTRQWKSWVTLSLGFFAVIVLPMLISFGVMYASMFMTMMAEAQRPRGGPPQLPLAEVLGLYLLFFAFILVLMPLTVLLMGGAYRAAFKQLRGGQVEFRDLFSARDCYWRLLGATLLQSVLITLGTLLCIIPGFIVAGMLFFTIPLIIDRNLSIADAIRASRELTQRNLFMFILFAFLVSLIASVGAYLCYVGLLLTWPLHFTITVAAYRDCFGVDGALKFSQTPSAGQPGYAQTSAVESPAADPQASVCPNCQASLPATAQFCFHCGTSVTPK